MLTKVEAYSEMPGVPVLPLNLLNAEQDRIQIHEIEGLGPVKAEITSVAFHDKGELYQGSSSGKRNIVMKLGLNPNWGIQGMSALRHELYKYFLPQAGVRLQFYSDDMPTVDISGYVESLDPNMFSEDPEIQLSVICPSPDFVAIAENTLNGTFYPQTDDLVIEYGGSVETGFSMTADIVDMVGGVSDLYADNYVINVKYGSEDPRFKVVLVNTSSAYYFDLVSIKGSKKIQYVHKTDGSTVNITRRVVEPSYWPRLRPGTNLLSTRVDRHVDAPPMDLSTRNWTLKYRNRYGAL